MSSFSLSLAASGPGGACANVGAISAYLCLRADCCTGGGRTLAVAGDKFFSQALLRKNVIALSPAGRCLEREGIRSGLGAHPRNQAPQRSHFILVCFQDARRRQALKKDGIPRTC